MKIPSILLALVAAFALGACGGGAEPEEEKPKVKIGGNSQTKTEMPAESKESPAPTADASADAMSNKGIGPVSSIELGDVDQGMVTEGEALFTKNCTACHKTDKRYIGPAIQGVTERRTPEWIMNMILNPTEMIAQDPLAKQLVGEYNGAVMANQNLTEEEARAILEYFRTL